VEEYLRFPQDAHVRIPVEHDGSSSMFSHAASHLLHTQDLFKTDDESARFERDID